MIINGEAIADLKAAISNYKVGTADLNALKAAVWSASTKFVAIEQKELRLHLQQLEAELDSLQFTVDDEMLHDEALKVVSRIESLLPA